MRIFYALSRMFFILRVVYHPACIWAGSPSIIQYPQGEGVWAVLVDGVQAPGPFSILGKGIEQHNKGFTMSQSLCFNEFSFTPVQHNDQPWIPARQLANALGYKDERSVHKIYERNKEEFSSMMSTVVNLTTGVMELPTRIFSLRGCHLLAMFARTPVAKAFRRWVLDVIERYGDKVPVAEPVTLNDTSRSSRRTDPERKALTSIINTWVGMAPVHYASARAQVNAHFGVTSVDALTVAQVKEAIQWVQAKIDALSAVPAPTRAPALPASNVYADRVKALTELERRFMEFSVETRTRLSELNAEYIRLNQGAYAAMLGMIPTIDFAAKDRLIDALASQSYDAYNWIDEGLHCMRRAILAARAANRALSGRS